MRGKVAVIVRQCLPDLIIDVVGDGDIRSFPDDACVEVLYPKLGNGGKLNGGQNMLTDGLEEGFKG